MLKAVTKWCIKTVTNAPAVHEFLHRPAVRDRLEKLPRSRVIYGEGWERKHPFDRAMGTDTSGYVPAAELANDGIVREHSVSYAGSHPSIIRTVLATIPRPETCTFMDLGCGKGRPLLVASEFPFRDIFGVEYVPDLADVARRNAALMAKKFPARTPVRVAVGDASIFPFPPGDVIVFLYHPFGEVLMAKVAAGIEAALAAESRTIYVIYYNPIAGHCFDASPPLWRRAAFTVPYGAEELGFGPDKEDTVVIWQGGTVPPVNPSANARIIPGTTLHASLESVDRAA